MIHSLTNHSPACMFGQKTFQLTTLIEIILSDHNSHQSKHFKPTALNTYSVSTENYTNANVLSLIILCVCALG